MAMTADDQRARQLLAPLALMPGGRALQRDLGRYIGGDQSELLGAIARAEAAIAIKAEARDERARSS